MNGNVRGRGRRGPCLPCVPRRTVRVVRGSSVLATVQEALPCREVRVVGGPPAPDVRVRAGEGGGQGAVRDVAHTLGPRRRPRRAGRRLEPRGAEAQGVPHRLHGQHGLQRGGEEAGVVDDPVEDADGSGGGNDGSQRGRALVACRRQLQTISERTRYGPRNGNSRDCAGNYRDLAGTVTADLPWTRGTVSEHESAFLPLERWCCHAAMPNPWQRAWNAGPRAWRDVSQNTLRESTGGSWGMYGVPSA